MAVGTLVMWWSWLGWDDGYQYDPVTGQSSGPSEVWQVVGCVLCLAVLALAGGALLGAVVTTPVMTLAFTIAWAVKASSADGDGLWPIGAALLFFGLGVGSAIVSLGAQVARTWVYRRARGATPLA